jgi:cytochrome c oxidase subunit 2
MRFVRYPACALILVLLAACGVDYPQSSVAPSTDFAQGIHELYVSIFWWTLLILVVVWGALAYIVVRFRARPDSPEPRQIHGHLGLELAWTIAPALIVVAIAIPTIQAVFSTQRGDPENALVVDVVGHQYWWEFRYPDTGVVTANELHLPVDRPVSLRLHSADVVHSFWVPRLGGKRDVNPLVRKPEGVEPAYTWLHFTASETGAFMGQCAEFCGDSHSLMGMRVIVESEADFEAWSQRWQASPGAVPGEGGTEALRSAGREQFLISCAACHGIEGSGASGPIAPDLTLLGTRSTLASGWLENTPENLARWIRDPRSVKPGVLMPGIDYSGGNWPATQLSDDQVEALVAYLSNLR